MLFTNRNAAYVSLNKIVNILFNFTVASGKEETNENLGLGLDGNQ
jgi:hypothetical protein